MKYETHDLKTLPEYFQAVKRGDKTFEARRDDRYFQVGDFLLLREWSPETGYTGQALNACISYILRGEEWGVMNGFAVLGFGSVNTLD